MSTSKRLTGLELETWFRDFARKAGILEDSSLKLEEIVRVFERRLQERFTLAKYPLEVEFPYCGEWIDRALHHHSLPPISEAVKKQFVDRLLDLVLATDAVVKVRTSKEQDDRIAIDITCNPHKQAEKVRKIRGQSKSIERLNNPNRNLPAVRKQLGFDKHLVSILSNKTDNLPSYDRLLSEIYAFAEASSQTRVIDLRDLADADKLNWQRDYEADPIRLWQTYSQGLTVRVPLERSIEVARREIQAGIPKHVVLRSLIYDPEYKRLLQRDNGNRVNADKYTKVVYSKGLDKHCMAQSSDLAQQKRNIKGLRLSEFIVAKLGSSNAEGEKVFAVKEGWEFRQKEADLAIHTCGYRGTILAFKNRTLQGTLTASDVQRLDKFVHTIQQSMQLQRDRQAGSDLDL